MCVNLRRIHGRQQVERDVTATRRFQRDKRLHVLEIVDLVVLTFAGVGVDGENQRLFRAELAANGTSKSIAEATNF